MSVRTLTGAGVRVSGCSSDLTVALRSLRISSDNWARCGQPATRYATGVRDASHLPTVVSSCSPPLIYPVLSYGLLANSRDYIVRWSTRVVLAISTSPIVGLCSLSMTSPESEFLQKLGSAYLRILEQLSILVFFYGASSSLEV